jgi:hypothetical protein
MSGREFDANLKVQELKPQVNEAMEVARSAEKLSALAPTKLGTLSAAVQQSIKYRSSLSSLGRDEGHEKRIQIEQALLETLNSEASRRKENRDRQRTLQENARLKAMPNILGDRPKGGPAWGSRG